MKYALVDGQRAQPKPRLTASCPYCQAEMVAKCGRVKMWHWAHKGRLPCDPWWEPETEWHRMWKDHFPSQNQEIVHFDSVTGEKHVADVKTDSGLIIELQNSPMPPDELKAREEFYAEMIWIVNGQKFNDNFFILDRLPDPDADFAQDIVFFPRTVEMRGRAFWRLSESPHHVEGSHLLVRVRPMEEISAEIEQHYIGHHLFDWKRPRSVWFGARRSVYLDFGCDSLFRLAVYKRYDEYALWCVQRTSKKSIVELNGGRYTPATNSN